MNLSRLDSLLSSSPPDWEIQLGAWDWREKEINEMPEIDWVRYPSEGLFFSFLKSALLITVVERK